MSFGSSEWREGWAKGEGGPGDSEQGRGSFCVVWREEQAACWVIFPLSHL